MFLSPLSFFTLLMFTYRRFQQSKKKKEKNTKIKKANV